MRASEWLQLALFVGALGLVTKPLGLYLVQALDASGKTWLDPVLKPLERLTYRLLGVDPASQGQGLGSRLLQPALARADLAHMPCYLETNNPSAVPFYQKLAFSVVEEHHAKGSGPGLWAMRREA